MTDLNDLIKRYSIDNDKKIKKICAPLENHLQIPYFFYYSIDNDGRFGIVGSVPGQLEFYYHQQLYLDNPYLNHPKFLRSGAVITQAIENPEYLSICEKKFFLKNLFIVINKTLTGLEGFLFGDPDLDEQHAHKYITNYELLKRFCNHFKREAKPMLNQMLNEGYNIHNAKGDAFLQSTPSLALSSDHGQYQMFMDALSPLSPRERQCLECYQKGHSSQTTAALLNLSRRTVEHYYESIKNKLGVYSKRDLLDY